MEATLEETSLSTSTKSVRHCASAVLIVLLLGIASVANANDDYPLRPPDTSSPRATMNGFIATTDDIYRQMKSVLETYAESDRLYPTAEERRQQLAALEEAPEAFRYLDLSHIPPVLRDTVSTERALQLKEILDRIEIPQSADIPDQDAMARQSTKRWRLPNTEIDIVRIENGPRAGEYLVSAETVKRLPEFYQRVKELPYKPGPGEQLASVYRKLSYDESATIYEAFLSSPTGLSFIFPPRWLLRLPSWAKMSVAGSPAWQWLGLTVASLIGGLIIWFGYRAARRPDDDEDAARPYWRVLLLPLAVIFVAGIVVPFFDEALRIGGSMRIVIDYTRTAAVFLGAAWLAILASAVLSDRIVASERLTIRSIDNQLIRLGTRLVGIMVAVAILIEGGDELGFPAYSVLAGLGVGGLAVALAAQSTIANLIGSLLIALEKPFHVGHYVKIGASEGTVEDVGFRCTRIRTSDRSLVSIPSSTVVSTTVENLSLRATRRQRLVVQVTYNTPREKLQELVKAVRQLLADNPLVEDSTCHVRVYNLGESSLDILVIFHLLVTDYTSELSEREAVLLQIINLADAAGVDFAFPTRTLHIENSAQNVLPWAQTDKPVLGLGGRN
jgi:MscS family membrane protein